MPGQAETHQAHAQPTSATDQQHVDAVDLDHAEHHNDDRDLDGFIPGPGPGPGVGVIDQTLRGIPLDTIARQRKTTVTQLLLDFATSGGIQTARKVTRSYEEVIRLELERVKMEALQTLTELAAGGWMTSSLTVEHYRAFETTRRACIAILRLNPFPTRRDSYNDERGMSATQSTSSSSSSFPSPSGTPGHRVYSSTTQSADNRPQAGPDEGRSGSVSSSSSMSSPDPTPDHDGSTLRPDNNNNNHQKQNPILSLSDIDPTFLDPRNSLPGNPLDLDAETLEAALLARPP